MRKRLLKQKISVSILVITIALGMAGPVSAIDHWWHGGISENVNDPANWTDRNSANDPTTPTGDPYDIVRIGNAWGSEDIDEDQDGDGTLDTWPPEDNNGNGVLDLPNGILDPGEDLNGNGIIDDPLAASGYNIVGTGGYIGSYDQGGVWIENGGGIDLDVDPVLSETYVSSTGTAEGGWWFVLNAPNILTLKDGAFLILNRENCMIRNGGRIEVQGRSSTGGPSLITARRFRISESGSIPAAAHETSQLRINGTGWMQVDPSLAGDGEAFMIGTSDEPGTMPRGEIIIENQGCLEILTGGTAFYLDFGNTDPNVNQIIIRDDGELLLPGDPVSMGRVGSGNTVTSLQEMIDTGLITNDQGSTLNVGGTEPTIITVAHPWATKPNPADGEPEAARQLTLSWRPSQYEVVYDVYFGTDVNSVTEATRDNPMDVLAVQGLEGTSFDLEGFLNFNEIYYWRVDAVKDDDPNSPWASPVWSFTTRNYVVVDDFEDYNDYSPDEVWNTWIDGYGDSTNGSSAGYPNPDFVAGEHYLEVRIVHSGKQSLPLLYDNRALISEVTKTLNDDWTQDGVITLTLFYHGVADNAPEQMFVAVDGVVVNNDDANAALVEEWTQWDIPLQSLADQGVNLNSVGSMTIGFGNKANPASSGSIGHVFFDDIRLYRPDSQ